MCLVSVIIPTVRRPQLLLRALASVFQQTHNLLDVVVVVDGPDEQTVCALNGISDARLRVVVNPQSMTAAGARNVGLDLATGDWVAFLDDDDEWLPEKISKQIAFSAERGPALISCLAEIMTPAGSFIRPQVAYDNTLPIDEYLFDRRSPFVPYGYIQTSSYLIPRAAIAGVRFRIDTPHDDWDFLLRVSKQVGLKVETVPEVLVKIHVEEERPSLSKSGTWLASLAWIDSIRSIVTRRAYSGFCLGVVGPRVVKENSYRGSVRVLYQSFLYGSPRFWRVASFLALWVAPKRLVQSLRAAAAR